MYPFDPYHRRKTSYDGYAPQPYRVQRFYSEPSHHWQEMDYSLTPRSNPELPSFAHNNLETTTSAGHALNNQRPGMLTDVQHSFSTMHMHNNSMLSYNSFGLYDTDDPMYSGLPGASTMDHVANSNHSHRFNPSVENGLYSDIGSIALGNDHGRRVSDSSDRTRPPAANEIESRKPRGNVHDAPCLDFSDLTPIDECTSVPYNVPSSRRPSSEPVSPVHAMQQDADHSRPDWSRSSSDKSQTTLLTDRHSTANAPAKTNARRRTKAKTSAERGNETHETTDKASKLRARQAHSLVERKYRENLNLKIVQLHERLQHTRLGQHGRHHQPHSNFHVNQDRSCAMLDGDAAVPIDSNDTEYTLQIDADNDSLSNSQLKVRKSDVMVEAMNYINTTEAEMVRLAEEVTRLTTQVKSLEKMMGCHDCMLWKQMVARQGLNTS